ncbi:MAG: DUF4105 domain-containing protein [Alphaproteobacteria bacterium]|nr:DUF4105 domain-containing protein [Alphaproteobacteria bacterium]
MKSWISRRPIVTGLLAALAIVLLWGAKVAFAKPRLDRDWIEHLATMPTINLREDGFSLGPAMDWAYDSQGPVSKSVTTASEQFSDLKNVWFVVEPDPALRPAAHTLVLFEFADDRMIGLTIEARREADEEYSAFWGLFNTLELAYIWSTPKELLTRRAVFLDHNVFVYPLALTDEQKLVFTRRLLEKTIDISRKPRFYNTLVSNCTNELAKSASLGWHYAFVLTGYSAERLYELKLIPGETFEAARETASMKERIVDWNGLATGDFDRALLGELRDRQDAARQTIGAGSP